MDSFEFHRSFHKCSVFYFIWFCNTRMQMVILFMQIDEQFSLQCQSQWQSMCSRHSRELAISTMAQQQKGWDSITQLLLQQLSLLYQSWVFCLMSSLMTMLQAVEMYIHGSSKLLAQSTCCLIVIDVLCHLLSLPDTELFTHHQAVASLVSDEHTAIRHAMSQCMSHLSTFVTPILQWACREWWNTYSSSQWVRITRQHNRVLSKQQQLTHAHRAEYFTAVLQHEHVAIHTIQQWQTLFLSTHIHMKVSCLYNSQLPHYSTQITACEGSPHNVLHSCAIFIFMTKHTCPVLCCTVSSMMTMDSIWHYWTTLSYFYHVLYDNVHIVIFTIIVLFV